MSSRDSDKSEKVPLTRVGDREDSTLQYDAVALVALQKVTDYLERNLDVFRDARRAPTVAIPIHEYGIIEGMRPEGHALGHQVRGSNIELRLSFYYHCEGDSCFTIPQPVVSERELLRQLRQDNLMLVSSRVRGRSENRQALTFEIKREIPAHIAFEVDGVNGVLRLELMNVRALGKERYLIKPEQVDAEFLNQLGRFVMHRHNAFLQESMLVAQGYPLSAEETEDMPDTASLRPAAEVLDFDPLTFTGKREIVLSYRDMSLSFDRHRSECLFGRKFPADIQVRSRYVSRAHATLRFIKDQFVFEDHSANGTFIRQEGKGAKYLQHESMRLRGRGVISLGVSITSGKHDLIYFEVV